MSETDQIIEETYELYQEYLNKWKDKRTQKDAIRLRKSLSILSNMCKKKRQEIQLERKNATTTKHSLQ